ncbi:MAG TPA: metal ABC transporter ATP-binding protein, partial [Candidatus Rokubacteria bacterium]|nr:metal ABC transporter ATP-binding protein [Candidatus Rokubacteria bacterium]
MPMTPLVELRGVSFAYEAVPVLEDVTLAVE